MIQRHLDKVLPALAKGLLSPFPWLRKLPLPANRALDGHLEALRVAVEGFIAGARERMAANPALRAEPANLIEAMVAARDREGSGLTDQDVAGNVLTMLLAGEDTTANSLAWMIYLLAPSRGAARARDEGAPGWQRAAAHARAARRPPWIEACMNETMRVKPVAPLIVLQAVRDTVLSGIRVPKGYLLILLMRGPTSSEKHFKNPAAFEPSRPLAIASRQQQRLTWHIAKVRRRSAPLPGALPRHAGDEMVMAMLLRNFDIQSVTTPDGGEAKEQLNLTMAPVGLRLRLSARS